MPVRQAPRCLLLHGGAEVDANIKAMLDADVIEEVEESEWAYPIVLVRNQDNSIRFWVDIRATNLRTRKSSHPLPRIEDTIEGMAKGTFYHSLDNTSACWKIKVAPEHRDRTTYQDTAGSYSSVWPSVSRGHQALFRRLWIRFCRWKRKDLEVVTEFVGHTWAI